MTNRLDSKLSNPFSLMCRSIMFFSRSSVTLMRWRERYTCEQLASFSSTFLMTWGTRDRIDSVGGGEKEWSWRPAVETLSLESPSSPHTLFGWRLSFKFMLPSFLVPKDTFPTVTCIFDDSGAVCKVCAAGEVALLNLTPAAPFYFRYRFLWNVDAVLSWLRLAEAVSEMTSSIWSWGFTFGAAPVIPMRMNWPRILFFVGGSLAV